MSQTKPVIHWFRRDLRLADNQALHAACRSGAPVLPVFVFDDHILSRVRVGGPRLAFMLQALRSLDEALREFGTHLHILRGEPAAQISALIRDTQAQALYFNADYSPYASQRDTSLRESLEISVHIFDDLVLMPPDRVLKADATPYMVYTPYKNKWNEQDKPAISEHSFKPEQFVSAEALAASTIPDLSSFGYNNPIAIPEASERAAATLLQQFIDQDAKHYSETRNYLVSYPYGNERPEGTSYLSPYLHLGLISPRTCYWAAREAYQGTQSKNYRESIATWVSELTWREFYLQIMAHYPHVLKRDFVDTYLNMAWQDDKALLDAWKNGETGYPVVDAPMRQLRAIGWMPNRARMIVASFLTKDLLIHWLEGDHYFMQHLIDGDAASNNGGWQWAAGTGTDAQPYFRIFNPVSQSEKFATPDYLRHWLPELQDVPDKHIHAPWLMDKAPPAYPAPIVDHAQAREATLAAFKHARGDK